MGSTGTYSIAYYTSYTVISVALTVWIARSLSRTGQPVLADIFSGRAELARSVESMLLLGFYLISLGYLAAMLTTNAPLNTLFQLVELESAKVGVFVMILGVIHLFNMMVLTLLRQKSAPTR